MSRSKVNINVKPSRVDENTKHEMAVEMITSARSAFGADYKYNYDFGIKKIDDSLIDIKQDSYQWRSPQDVELIVRCTAPGNEVIGYVHIYVDQSSTEHAAKIIAGGIGEKYIEVLVTARNTYWYKYDARFYGHSI